MTTLLDKKIDGRATHVLVIGVGVYPHLLGGARPLDNPMGLKQLGSPPRSALQFLEWVLAPGFNPPVPLGSVEAVISAEPTAQVPVSGTGAVAVEPATMANIEEAFDTWYAKCDRHRDNIAVFYHCGHGLQREDLALIAEDFGDRPNRLWGNAFNFTKTYDAMAHCKARGQYFFVDACRQVTTEVRDLVDFNVEPLMDPKLRDRHVRDTLILYATSRDAKAHAPKDQATRFTQALLKVLKGPGAAKIPGGQWGVTTRSLATAVIGELTRTSGPRVPHQDCTSDGEASGTVVLHVLPGKPEVPAHVEQKPPLVANRTELEFASINKKIPIPRAPAAWDFVIEAGVYRLDAIIDGDRMLLSEEEWVTPPYYTWPEP